MQLGQTRQPGLRGRTGFTLVELLITSGILIILSAATLVSTNISATERQLDQAVHGFALAVNAAQSLALAPPVNKTIGNAGYRLLFITDPSQPALAIGFEIREIGSLPGQVPAVISNALVREGQFPVKIAFRLAGGGSLPSFVFSIPGQGDIIEPDSADGLISIEAITRRGGSLRRNLTVSTETGQVDITPPS